MPNQHTARARRDPDTIVPPDAGMLPPDDGPDLGPDVDADTSDAVTPLEPAPVAVTVTPDELAAMVAEAVEAATAPLMAKQRAASEATTVLAVAADAPRGRPVPPAEPTYEPAYIPTAEDYAEANAAEQAGQAYDEPVALAATITVVAPDGSTTECTPKVFRTILQGRGYVAHPEDAVRHLGGESRRRRRTSTASEQAVATGRRRRRSADTITE